MSNMPAMSMILTIMLICSSVNSIKLVNLPTISIQRLSLATVPQVQLVSMENEGTKPPFLFLPGLDGVGSYSAKALESLSDEFDVHTLSISPGDRTSFLDLASIVSESLAVSEEKVTICGESFGGLLATYLASKKSLKDRLKQVVLINPATSFDRTAWNTIAPVITNSGALYPALGLFTLLATAVTPDQITRIGDRMMKEIKTPDEGIDALKKLVEAASDFTQRQLPSDTLQFRIDEWLAKGAFYVNNKYEDITIPTLILIGNKDRLLPSGEEGRILSKALKNAMIEVKIYDDLGHALLDGSIDLKRDIVMSKFYQQSMRNDVALTSSATTTTTTSGNHDDAIDCPYPSKENIDKLNKNLGFFFKSLSPIFLHRTADGVVRRGLSGVPTAKSLNRPVLFVGNHQLFGADLGILVKQFLDEKETLIRGLAHPLLFEGENDSITTTSSNDNSDRNSRRGDSTMKLFTTFGAVKVTPGNYLELLKRKETILLFPGGVKEAYHGKGDDLKLFWPEKVDFVRMAALFDAVIVPYAGIGISDSVKIVLSPQDILNLPIVGSRAREQAARIPQARPNGDDIFIAPLAIPKLPARNYFLFDKPFDTRNLDIYNKSECKQAYEHLRSRVECNIDVLKRFREDDMFSAYPVRQAYELLTGAQAPTASLISKALR